MVHRYPLSVLVVFLVWSSYGRSDELVFRNGDQLTGKVVTLEGGRLDFDSEVAGKITVKIADLRTFATDAVVRLRLADGTVVEDRVLRSDEGSARLGAGGALPLESIDAINPEQPRWHGRLKAGLTVERGNTDSQDGVVEIEFRRRGERYRVALSGGYEGSRSRASGEEFETTKRRLNGTAQLDRFFTERFYGYLRTDAERDGLADLRLRSVVGPGTGYQVYDRDDLSLSVEGGLKWVHEDSVDETRDTDYVAGRLAWRLERALSDPVRLFHSGSWVPSLRDFTDSQLVRLETGLRSKLFGGWFGEAKVRWRLNTEPASGTDRTDVTYLFLVGWGF